MKKVPTLQELNDIATRQQVLLERLKTSTARDFTSVLTQLEDTVAEIVGTLKIDKLNELSRAKLEKLLRQVRDAQKPAIEKANDSIIRSLRDLAGYQSELEATLLGRLLGVKLASKSAKVAFDAALRQPVSATGQLLKNFVSGWGERHLIGVERAVRRAYANGNTVQDLVRTIRGTKKQNYQDGLVTASKRQAEAVARTAVQHTASTSRMATWEANSDIIPKYRWISTLDSRTTQQCRSLDGREFKLNEGPRPPIHINCRSTTSAVLDKKYAVLEKGATRSSQDGYVPADQSYYSWLKRQPKDFQDVALGPTRGQLFRKGGLSEEQFAALNLNRNFEPLSLKEMRKLAPEVFERAGV